MFTSAFLSLVLATGAFSQNLVQYTLTQTTDSCKYLYKNYPNATVFPGEPRYAWEDTVSWSTGAWRGPSCVFLPYDATMVSEAVKLFSARKVPFAVRGGGALPIDDAANIAGHGILISSSNMSSITVSADRKTVSVGSGVRWPQLYEFLDPLDLAVNGVRLGDTGVTGFHLGGGVGFYSNEHGMGPKTIKEFECVLANGTITTASENVNPDLFWALKGGGNSFCVVTRLNILAFEGASAWMANVEYGADAYEPYTKGFVDIALYSGKDPKAATEAQIRWNPSRNANLTYWAYLFYNGNSSTPEVFKNVTGPVLPFQSGNMTIRTMNTWTKDIYRGQFDNDNRKRLIFTAIPCDLKAYRIAIDTYYQTINELKSVRGFFTAFTVMSITEEIIKASAGNGGNPLNLQEKAQLWLVESPSWNDGQDDRYVDAIHAKANAKIKENLRVAGFEVLPFVYLNDAPKGAPVFEGYGQENWQKLKDIRAKYDPGKVFTRLLEGGFKVDGNSTLG